MIKGTPVTILLVEDDPAHAEIVRRNLGDFRVANRIVHVADGQAALDYLFHQAAYADPRPVPDRI
jgi:CheY-like chemotaxis protein